jgi:hypothetical protein
MIPKANTRAAGLFISTTSNMKLRGSYYAEGEAEGKQNTGAGQQAGAGTNGGQSISANVQG